MKSSIEYRNLKSRVKQLGDSFLPADRQDGNYTKLEKDKTRSYILLVHAEIEDYFETVAKQKAKKVFSTWENGMCAQPPSKKISASNVLISLALFYSPIKESKVSSCNIVKDVNNALSKYCEFISKNHGIKEDNILGILLPIGIQRDQLDQTLLNNLSSFGRERGEIAHTSVSIQMTPDPLTTRKKVEDIVNAISELDKTLLNL